MSDSDTDADGRVVPRSVSWVSREYRNPEMGGIGWAIFLGLVVLLVPLLPFILVVWVIGKLLDYSRAGD